MVAEKLMSMQFSVLKRVGIIDRGEVEFVHLFFQFFKLVWFHIGNYVLDVGESLSCRCLPIFFLLEGAGRFRAGRFGRTVICAVSLDATEKA
jgi:hypothetical protein